MSDIQLTFDSRQDRVLFCSGKNVAMPNWWMTRREVRRLLKSISTVTMSQYETEKMIEKFSAKSCTEQAVKAKAKAESRQKTCFNSYREFHQAHAGSTLTKVSQSTEVELSPENFPLACRTHIDLSHQQGIKLFIMSEYNRGVCLEFSQEGLYRFNNMLFTVAQKAQWI